MAALFTKNFSVAAEEWDQPAQTAFNFVGVQVCTPFDRWPFCLHLRQSLLVTRIYDCSKLKEPRGNPAALPTGSCASWDDLHITSAKVAANFE
jgi:hypothetical protein